MRTLLVVDRDFAHRELSHIRTVMIGLVEAGWMPVLALPSDMCHSCEELPGVQLVGYRDRGVPWTRRVRSRELVDLIADQDAMPAVVHGFGRSSHQIAAEVARQLGCLLVLEVHTRSGISRVTSLARERSGECLLLTPCAPLARGLVAAGVSPAMVRELPWGVMKSEYYQHRQANESMGIVLAGSGGDSSAWESVVRALAQIASRREDFVILADADAVTRSGVGKVVGSFGLSPLFSQVPKLDANRGLAVRADILVLPDAEGECRSLLFDAMSAGMAVVAAEDRDVPALSDASIIKLVTGGVSDWTGGIESLLENADERAHLGNAAREYVLEFHRPSKYTAGLVDSYEWMLGKDSIPLAKGAS